MISIRSMNRRVLVLMTMLVLALPSIAVTIVKVEKNDGEVVTKYVNRIDQIDYYRKINRTDTTCYYSQYVDMGLPSGTLWATCNVGASKPEACGWYFAWGETTPKDVYSWKTYKWCETNQYDNLTTLTKYSSGGSYSGTIDDLTVLLAEDDAASVNCGVEWKTPTQEEWTELFENCQWSVETINGVKGVVFIAENGQWIFLPSVGSYTGEKPKSDGSTCYWSSGFLNSSNNYAYSVSVRDVGPSAGDANYRYVGLPVRPVLVSKSSGEAPVNDLTYTTFMNVKSTKGKVVRYNVDDLAQVYFDDDPTIIDELESPLKFRIISRTTATTDEITAEIIKDKYTLDTVMVPTQVLIDENVYTVTRLDETFNRCTSLHHIEIPSTITEILYGTFYGCVGLTEIVIPSSVTHLGNNLFYGCKNLERVSLPSNINYISHSCFEGCVNLKEIEIPSSVLSIHQFAFENCRSLKSVFIPLDVHYIGENVFSGCDSLAEISVDSNNSYFSSEGNVLYDKEKTELVFALETIEGDFVVNPNVTKLRPCAFYGCQKLTSVELPSSIDTIPRSAFWNCNQLSSIEIPSNVNVIDDYAFGYCESLTSIEIPSNVTYIGSHAFWNCTGLTKIRIPSSVTSIESYAFRNCKDLEIEIDNSEDNVSIASSAFNDVKSVKFLK